MSRHDAGSLAMGLIVRSIVVTWLLIGCGGGDAHAQLEIASSFSDHMVIQRDAPIVVHGVARADEEIDVAFGESHGSSRTDARGHWRVALPPRSAGGPYAMEVRGEQSSLRLKDIFVGDVWICAGSTNMSFPVARSLDASDAVGSADDPKLSLVQVPRRTGIRPTREYPSRVAWRPSDRASVADFSAVAYYFGRELRDRLGVPIGLIEVTWPETPIEPWIARGGFEPSPPLKRLLDETDARCATYYRDLDEALPSFQSWLSDVQEALSTGIQLPAQPDLPRHPLTSEEAPTSLFNGMVSPLTSRSIRGVIWAQGERNVGDGMLYQTKMLALIRSWRAAFDRHDLPICQVQLAPYNYGVRRATEKAGTDPDPFRLPEFWRAQLTTLTEPQTGLISTSDIADVDLLLYPNKRPVGKRLADWAIAATASSTVAQVPQFASAEVEGAEVCVTFLGLGDSTLTASDGNDLTWFELANEAGQFFPAVATITKDRAVVVRSDSVAKPTAIRFGWHQVAQPNLVTSSGHPVAAFAARLSR